MIKNLPIVLLLVFLFAQVEGTDSTVYAADELQGYIKLLETDKLLATDLCEPDPNIDRTIQKSTLTDVDGKEFEVSMISYEYLVEIFNDLASRKNIPFRYPEDGCYARAHEMSAIMEKLKVITGKVFIEGSLHVDTTNSPKGYVEWWYHVAPIVKVKKGDEELVYVVDPSLFDKPVPAEEWYKIQTKHQTPPPVVEGEEVKDPNKKYYTTRFHYQPYDGEKTEFTKDDQDDVKQTMESYMKIQEQRDADKKQVPKVPGGPDEKK